jgi:hypothetical protein
MKVPKDQGLFLGVFYSVSLTFILLAWLFLPPIISHEEDEDKPEVKILKPEEAIEKADEVLAQVEAALAELEKANAQKGKTEKAKAEKAQGSSKSGDKK